MDRKEFLELVGRSALFAATLSPADIARAASARGPLTPRQRLALRAVADVIVPASEGMPAAGELGAAAYLVRLAAVDTDVAKALRDAMASVERTARARHRVRFERLTAPARLAVLQEMEKSDADRFRALRDFVYEAYYTHPEVWRRLGYEFITGEGAGRSLEPFEEALLERVRTLPRLYREVR